MTTISQTIIVQPGTNAGSVSAAGGSYTERRRENDGYASFGGSLLRNTAIGTATGAIAGAMIPGMLIPGAVVGGVAGAASAAIKKPRVAQALGDGMKAAGAGAAGGAVVGTITPFGPLGGAVAGAAGGFLTGTASSLLKNVAGGRLSVENEKTVLGRITKGAMMGAVSGGTVGAGAGLLFGGIGAVPGALWGAAMGAVGGAIYGATTGVTDAATGAKGVSFTGRGGSSSRTSTGDGYGLPNLREKIERWTDADPRDLDRYDPRQYDPECRVS